MKNLLLLALALAPVCAPAAEVLKCTDGKRNGYRAEIERLSKAELSKGSETLSKMRCVLPHGFSRPGRSHLVAVCTGRDNTDDKGFILYVHALANGATTVEVDTESNEGPQFFLKKDLDCRAE